MTQRVAVLGSTGSIGVQALEVIAHNPDAFEVVALAAGSRADALLAQCCRFKPAFAVLADDARADWLRRELARAGLATQLRCGAEGLCEVAALAQVDSVIAAIVGAAGLLPTLAAARAGKRVLLANKEALVMAGELLLSVAREHGACLLPVDSEHNAIFQCLPPDFARGLSRCGVTEIVLTASGGPFRDLPLEQFAAVTPAQACAHPNWEMGRKISVDSATMMNKGLEVIEAHWLFSAAPGQIAVLMHRASIVHSLVRLRDGSVLAQLGNPDMRTPIAHALAWPGRIDAGVAPLDLVSAGPLEFEPIDERRFPCLALAYQALRRGGTAAAVLNAANEVAVQAFLDGKLRFDRIHEIIAATLADEQIVSVDSLETVLDADRGARQCARGHVERVEEVTSA